MSRDLGVRATTRATVSADKAFEMEFLFAREEIRVRMDYNRRLLAGQVTLIAALIAGGISFSSKDGTINPTLLQGTAAAVIWLTAAFIFENTSNNSHIQSRRFSYTTSSTRSTRSRTANTQFTNGRLSCHSRGNSPATS